MSEIGDAVLVALWDQGWALSRVDGEVLILRPIPGSTRTVLVAIADDRIFRDVNLADLLFVLLDVLQAEGLVWPWPPEPTDTIRGSG